MFTENNIKVKECKTCSLTVKTAHGRGEIVKWMKECTECGL